MITKAQALAMRRIIENNAPAYTDTDAAEVPFLLPAWSGENRAYNPGDRVQYEGKAYKCLQAHISQTAWMPADAPSLWAEILIPDPEVIPDWVQPGSTNPYMKGDKVKHNGKTWMSDIDNNVWEPGVYGWSVAE
ncbi:MAG: alpha-amylase [Lachnospiraceae bacterium]|nr:alpha-amylase [Lachnospiraceae bacterium]